MRVSSGSERLRPPRGRPPVRGLLAAVALLALGLIAVTGMNFRTAVRVAQETLRNQA